MLFKRRSNENVWTKARLAVWPRRNHARSSRYVMKRVLRIRGTPHAIAVGVAAGVFASFTPLMGFHILLSLLIAFLLRGSFISAALGTAVGNPLTFPAIWAATLGVGRTLLGSDMVHGASGFLEALKASGFIAVWEPFILPMLVGAMPLGIVSALIFYWITRSTVAAFQKRRADSREKRENDRKERAEDNGEIAT